RLFKLPVTTPEGLYVSFPFKLPDGRLRFEVQGGVVYPGINQLEGSSSDWNTIQNFASVANKDAQIVFVSPEIPLVQFDNLNIGRYYYRLKPKTNHLFSWVLNNYWVTNFKASQEGELRWNYYITSKSDPSIAFASRFGWGARTPLPSRVMMADAQASGTTLVSKSFLPLDIANLLLVQVTPSLDNQGVILHLRETDGNHVSLNIDEIVRQLGAKSASEVNVLEEKLSDVSGKLWFDHFETKFLKFIFQED
ncbi:MAG: hypothetical protein JNJ57_22135, partial [Saprospiraceae bacterium]|nr:hypothetical protein [Saprospiraceae bacterium]